MPLKQLKNCACSRHDFWNMEKCFFGFGTGLSIPSHLWEPACSETTRAAQKIKLLYAPSSFVDWHKICSFNAPGEASVAGVKSMRIFL